MQLPRILIGAPSSGSGKTLITCGILQLLKNGGKKAISFKCGPDYIDPMFHSRVIGMKSRNLDSFFTDRQTLRGLMRRNGKGSDLAALFRAGPLSEAAAAGAALTAPGSGELTAFERLCDNAVMNYLAQARRIPFGEQAVIGYLYARENEFTAIRTILSGRMAGLDGDTIRQRLRRTYG